MTDVTLSPEQERFAAEVVASGRYRDVSEVVGAALDGLRQLERQRAELLASVIAAERALQAAGVENTGVKVDTVQPMKYVAFKDPDRISWEFYMV